MHRLTAKLLLLLALAANFIPLALAATGSPPHACCIRKAANHCHESAASEQNEPSIRASGCCGHDCDRGAPPNEWGRRAVTSRGSLRQKSRKPRYLIAAGFSDNRSFGIPIQSRSTTFPK